MLLLALIEIAILLEEVEVADVVVREAVVVSVIVEDVVVSAIAEVVVVVVAIVAVVGVVLTVGDLETSKVKRRPFKWVGRALLSSYCRTMGTEECDHDCIWRSLEHSSSPHEIF
jgi:hypothetical protein